MSDEQKTPSGPDTTPPKVDKDGRPLAREIAVAEGPNDTAHADQAKAAHAAPDGDVEFITHEDGSKSVPYADTPQRREED